MRKDKEIATRMRNQGKSYLEIHAALQIPRATLSDWFKDLDWSRNVRHRLARISAEEGAVRLQELSRVRGQQLKRAYETAESEARAEFENLKYHPAFIAGVLLYWREGAKSPRTNVQLSSSDPALIRLFYFFLREVCGVPEDRITGHLLLYPDLEEKVCRAYWAQKSGMPWGKFSKSVRVKGRRQTRRLTLGVCTITASSVYLKRKMLVWMELLPQELMKWEYYATISPDLS